MSDAAPVRIPLDLYSPEQLSAVIIELRAHCAAVRDAAVRAKVSSDTGVAPVLHTSALLLAVLREASVAPTDQPALEKLLRQLEVIRDRAPDVHLMMAALPNRELKRKFTDWFRTQIHPYTMLTFATRTDIGGGVIIQAGSHIYNYSFREQILSHRSRISEMYHSVR